MSEINLTYYRLTYIFCIDFHRFRPSKFDQHSVRFHASADQRRLSLTPSSIPVTMRCCELLTAVMKRGDEAKRGKAEETRERQQRDVDAQMRWGTKKEEKKGKKGICRSGSRRIKGPLVLFNPAAIYTLVTSLHARSEVRLHLSLSLSLNA